MIFISIRMAFVILKVTPRLLCTNFADWSASNVCVLSERRSGEEEALLQGAGKGSTGGFAPAALRIWWKSLLVLMRWVSYNLRARAL